MYVNPGEVPDLAHGLTHEAAERVSKDWWRVLVNGLLLIVAGILIFSIDWSVSSLSLFLGVLFIVEGIMYALTTGFDSRVKRSNVITGLLSIALGIAVIVWPSPGLVALGIVLGAWLIVLGTLAISASLTMRKFVKDWWLFLIDGMLMIPLGVLALADPGGTLAAIVTVGGLFGVVVGVVNVVTSFEIKRLPQEVDKAWAEPTATNGSVPHAKPATRAAA